MQRELPRAKAHVSLAHDSLRDVLPEGTTIEKRADGSVWLIEQLVKPTGKDGKQLGPDRSERRIDSRQDRDMIARGEEPWYTKHLRAKSAAKSAKEPTKEPAQ